MNRFKIKLGVENEFIEVWRERETFLNEVPGFKSFHLLQGASFDEFTLFVSHTTWDSESSFVSWTHSEAFKKAHKGAGLKSKNIYMGTPQFEGFTDIPLFD